MPADGEQDGDYEDQVIEDALADALRRLFQNRVYLPLYPFQTITQTLLHHDAFPEGLSARPVDYFHLPTRALDFTIHVAKFGATDFYGSGHLAKLVSSRSLAQLKATSNAVFEALGKPASTINTDHIQAHYVELFPVTNVLSAGVSYPRPHRLDMIVEVFITAKTFEECVNVFIRKVLEDANKAHTADLVVSAHISVRAATTQTIDITTMKQKRQQVLATLKAAIVNEHDISLAFYLGLQRTLPVFHEDFATRRETALGFVRVRRKYKLTFTERDAPENIRCFTQHPLESLTVGIFHTSKDADQCIEAYRRHLQGVEEAVQRERRQQQVAATRTADGILINYISHLSREALRLWDGGQYLRALEQMLLLVTIFDNSVHELSFVIGQIKSVLTSLAGHVHSVRDALRSLERVMALWMAQTQTSAAVQKYLHGHALAADEQTEVRKYLGLYRVMSEAVLEARQLLQELLGAQGRSAELVYVQPLLAQAARRYFEPVAQARTKLEVVWAAAHARSQRADVALSTDDARVSTDSAAFQLLFANLYALHDAVEITAELDGLLFVLETNVAVEVLNHLVQLDVQAYAITIRQTQNTRLLYKLRNASDELPKSLTDLLGFLHMRARASAPTDVLYWRVTDVSRLLYAHMALLHAPAPSRAADVDALLAAHEGSVHTFNTIHDLYALLQAPNFRRWPALDRDAVLAAELSFGDMPTVLLRETAQIRYLREASVLAALQRARFMAATCPQHVPKYLALTQELLPHAIVSTSRSFLRKADQVRAFLFDVCAQDRMHLFDKKMMEGPFRLRLASLPLHVQALLSGGVLGNDRLLSALGRDYEALFLLAWHLPPCLPMLPRSSVGIRVRILGGMSAHTALHLAYGGNPLYAEAIDAAGAVTGTEAGPGPGSGTGAVTVGSDEAGQASAPIPRPAPPAAPEGPSSPRKRSVMSSVLRRLSLLREPAAAASAPSQQPFTLDSGVMTPPPVLRQEVVYYAEYDAPPQLPVARQQFAQDVVQAVQFMVMDPRWQFHSILVPSASAEDARKAHMHNIHSEKGAAFVDGADYVPAPNLVRFTAVALGCGGGTGGGLDHAEEIKRLERALAKAGRAIVLCAALVPEPETRCSLDELGSLFQQSRSPEKAAAARTKAAGRGAGRGARPARDAAPRLDADTFAFSPRTVRPSFGAGLSNSAESLPGKTRASLREAGGSGSEGSDGEEGYGDREEAEAEVLADLSASFDATYSDTTRLCASSHVAQQLATALAAKPAPVSVYVPAELTFTLIAKHRLYHLRGAAAPLVYSPAVGSLDPSITVGLPADLSRLLSATVYFSAEAAKYVYGLLYKNPALGHAQSLCYQSVRAMHLFKHCQRQGDAFQAAEHLALYLCLSQNFALLPIVCHMENNVAVKLTHLAQLVAALERSFAAKLTACDAHGLAFTVARYADLCAKYLLTSPAVTHLRGAAVECIRLLNALRQLLHLAAIPVARIRDALPRTLQPFDGLSLDVQNSALSANAAQQREDAQLLRQLGLRRAAGQHQDFDEQALVEEEKAKESAAAQKGKGGSIPLLHMGLPERARLADDEDLEAGLATDHTAPTRTPPTAAPNATASATAGGPDLAVNAGLQALVDFKDRLKTPSVVQEARGLLDAISKQLKCIAFASMRDLFAYFQDEVEDHLRAAFYKCALLHDVDAPPQPLQEGAGAEEHEARLKALRELEERRIRDFGRGLENVGVALQPTRAVVQTLLPRNASVSAIVHLVERAQSATHHLLAAADVAATASGQVHLLGGLAAVGQRKGLERGFLRGFRPTDDAQRVVVRQLLRQASQHDVVGEEAARSVEERVLSSGRYKLKKQARRVQQAQRAVQFLQVTATQAQAQAQAAILQTKSTSKQSLVKSASGEPLPADAKDDGSVGGSVGGGDGDREERNEEHISFVLGAGDNEESMQDLLLDVDDDRDGYSVDSDDGPVQRNQPFMASWADGLLADGEPKSFLSAFRDARPSSVDALQRAEAVLQREEQREAVGEPGSFSAIGFQLLGASVQEAAQQGSVLSVLRAFGGVEAPTRPPVQQERPDRAGTVNPMFGDPGAPDPEDSMALDNFRRIQLRHADREAGEATLGTVPALSSWRS